MNVTVYANRSHALTFDELAGTGPDDPAADGTVYLTPDALMAYCEARLQSLDQAAESAMAAQQLRNGEQQDLQHLIALFQADAKGIGTSGNGDPGECEQLENALAQEIMKLKKSDPGSPALSKLIQAYNDMVWTGTGNDSNVNPTGQQPFTTSYIDRDQFPPHTGGPEGDCVISDSEMQGFITSLQGAASDLSSCAELQMIQLQSLMSQRQTAIQLTTNLVQSLGDQLNKIADNIGH
jgi:DNA-binding protein H-NS